MRSVFFIGKKGGRCFIEYVQIAIKALRYLKNKPILKKILLAASILLMLIPFLLFMVLNNLIGDLTSMIGLQKMGEEKYKQEELASEFEVPRDLLQEYYIPVSIEFGIPWSVIAALHAVQTKFAKTGGLFYSDAFDLPNGFWDSFQMSRRDYEWHKLPHTEKELEEHEHILPERDRFEDIMLTIAKYLSTIQKWDNRNEVNPMIKAITKFNDKTDNVMAFSWVYNFQYAASGSLLSLEPSQYALGIIPPQFLELYKKVEEEYQIPWNYIAAFHFIESRFGTYVNPITKKLMVSEAGALGHFQFMPLTWQSYGVDKNGGGADPFNVEDAAFSCGNYLSASGFQSDVDMAIYAYNHDWGYVSSIKAQAALFAEHALGPIGEFVIPVVNFTISSPFGPRWGRLHKGVDIPGPLGTTIYSYAAGKVVYAGKAGGYGTLITIDHGNGMQTRYGHSRRLYVSAGQEIPAGYPIAAMGNEGRSVSSNGGNGSHLHFEVMIKGKHVDPMPYLSR